VQAHPEYVIKPLLHGLHGAIDGKTYAGGTMVGMKENDDAWIASVASIIRTRFANKASLVTPEQVAAIRAATADRNTPYSYDELIASTPKELERMTTWKVSASHSAPTRLGASASPVGAFTHEGWTTGEAQGPGMWFQVELPAPVTLVEVHFESPSQRRGFGSDAPPPLMTSPRILSVQVSLDGETWSTVSEGEQESTMTTVSIDPTEAKFIRFVQSGQPEEAPWSMQQLKFFVM
jgi:hypothetical protein